MVRLRGITALREGDGIEVLASIGNIDSQEGILADIMESFSHALEQHHAIFEQDCFVGYHPTRQGKINLLYMKGVHQLDEAGYRCRTFFHQCFAGVQNMYLNREIFDTQSELIYRLGEVVESRCTTPAIMYDAWPSCRSCLRAWPVWDDEERFGAPCRADARYRQDCHAGCGYCSSRASCRRKNGM